jgi:hypothetical protein
MRKKVVLIGVSAALIFLGILSYKIWFPAFIATKYLSGRKDGKQGMVRSIIIPWRNYRLHVHHWLLALIVGVVLALTGYHILTPELSYGALAAIVFQGIYCYEDWYQIIERKSDMAVAGQPEPSLIESNDTAAESPEMMTEPLLGGTAG